MFSVRRVMCLSIDSLSGIFLVVKLWTIKTNECENTFDEQHNAKIWGLAVTKDQSKLVTGILLFVFALLVCFVCCVYVVCLAGGEDSILNVWKDVTAEEREQVP